MPFLFGFLPNFKTVLIADETKMLLSLQREYIGMIDFCKSIFIELSGSLASFILGVITMKILSFLREEKPIKNLWRISNEKELVIYASTSTNSYTGIYMRPSTGIGQVRALGHILESLGKAYDINVRNINLSINQIQDLIEKDLILLGGPKNNEISRLLIQKVTPIRKIIQTNEGIEWDNNDTFERYTPIVENKKVKKDYGLVIRMLNPFDSHKKSFITLFSGCHTYGTVAASKYFTEHYVKEVGFFKKKWTNVFLIVECDVVDGYPVDIVLKSKYEC